MSLPESEERAFVVIGACKENPENFALIKQVLELEEQYQDLTKAFPCSILNIPARIKQEIVWLITLDFENLTFTDNATPRELIEFVTAVISLSLVQEEIWSYYPYIGIGIMQKFGKQGTSFSELPNIYNQLLAEFGVEKVPLPIEKTIIKKASRYNSELTFHIAQRQRYLELQQEFTVHTILITSGRPGPFAHTEMFLKKLIKVTQR